MIDDGHPLKGINVLDLSTGISGGFCSKLLADLGADVIKLEPPGGDPLRRWSASGSPIAEAESGALFRFLNTSKRSTIVDLTQAEDREKALRLVDGCDVVVENFAPGMVEDLGMDLVGLARISARVSLVSISPFGRRGPWRDRSATEFTLLGWSGAMSTRGRPEGAPVAVGGRVGEWLAGLNAATGALLAVHRARHFGQGEHVDVSMLEAMTTAYSNYLALAASMDGKGPAPLAVPRFVEVPSIEPAKDGWVGFCTNSAAQFATFCELVGHPEWTQDPRYNRWDQRPLHHKTLRAEIAKVLSRWTVDETIAKAGALRVPVSPVGNGERTPRFDLCVERQMFESGPDGDFIQPRSPLKFSEANIRPFASAPGLSEGKDLCWLDEAAPVGRADAEKTVEPAEGRLAGLRVVDFTSYWAGPLASHVFALMGADVIKLESIQRPDGTRLATAYETGDDRAWERQPLFYGLNSSKRAITLNLKSAEGLKLFEELVAESDLLFENYSPRVLDGIGLGYDRLREINPGLIMVRMPAWGLDGSWSSRPAFAQTMEQFTGMAWLTGETDAPPIGPRGPCDPVAGMYAATAALAALSQRERTGRGQLVEVTMAETALNVAAEQVLEYSAYGELLERQGNRGPVSAPQGVYPCAAPTSPEFERAPELELEEHWVALACETDEQWGALCDWLGEPPWTTEEGLDRQEGRRSAHDRIDAELAGCFVDKPQDLIVEELARLGVPIAPVVHARAVDENPQMRARHFFAPISHPVSGEHEIPGLPMTFSGRHAPWHRSHPPLLGEHNDEVLGELLGLDEGEIQALRDAEVIGERPLGR